MRLKDSTIRERTVEIDTVKVKLKKEEAVLVGKWLLNWGEEW